jgi:hypothetical protein
MSWPSPVETVSITIDGVTYEGTYYVQGGTVYVQSKFGDRATQVGGSPPEAIAHVLTAEQGRQTTSML